MECGLETTSGVNEHTEVTEPSQDHVFPGPHVPWAPCSLGPMISVALP